jgi:hypothetical protein
MVADCLADRRVALMTLVAPTPVDEDWEADKSGWRAFVMGNPTSGYRPESRLQTAWQRGYDAASRSSEPVGLML